MKARIRVLSLLLALLMLLSLAPELKLHAAAAPADPTAKAPPVPADPAAVPTDPAQPQEDDTDLTIDFNYEKEHNVKSREEALRLTVDSQYHYTEVESKSELDAMFVKTIGGKQADFHWKKFLDRARPRHRLSAGAALLHGPGRQVHRPELRR